MTIHSLHTFNNALLKIISTITNIPLQSMKDAGVTVQLLDANQAQHGDFTTNAAMVLAREVKTAPRMLAQKLIATIEEEKSISDSALSAIKSIEIAGPGFINIRLTDTAWQGIIHQFLHNPINTIQTDHQTPSQSYLIEFVSANPTGPLHLGHGRNAIIGDVLRRILEFCGHQVSTEFYINDAGVQMEKLGSSLQLRCKELLGEKIEFPEDGYHGDYIVDLAKEYLEAHKETALTDSVETFTAYASSRMLQEQRDDLTDYRVTFHTWFSEKTLHESGAIDAVLERLRQADFLYEDDGALWFRATQFGDDKDRVIRKKDGSLTYIAADIAYHVTKFERNLDHYINILGQDHHGYVLRLKGTMTALGYDAAKLEVILYQLVSIKKGTLPVRMSKRAGTFTSLRDVIDTVGADAARFFFLHKKVESHLELDIEVALKKTQENPVFYLQYAYVRTKSLLARAQDAGITIPDSALSYTFDASEVALIKKVLGIYTILSGIEKSYATHLLAQYALELAQEFHIFYTNNKIVDAEQPTTTARRLVMVMIMQRMLQLVHELLGITPLEKM